MNRKIMLFGAVYSIFGMSAIVFSVPSFALNNVFAYGTRTSNTHIVLDKFNKPDITSGSGSLTYNEYATFSYVGASIKEDYHVSLADGGTLYKNEASNSLSSFLVSFSGNLILHTGYNGVDDTCYEYTLESGVSTDVKGNYFKLISSGATDIESIDISFGCLTEDSETHTPSSTWSHDETKHWHECEDSNCVRKLDEANHVVRNLAQIDPTDEETGLTAGTDCSVCGRILSGREVLPVLDQLRINYEYRRRTTKVGDVVADFDEYIWLNDSSVVIHNNPGDPLTEYVHAGSSYYSIDTWNDLFPNQEAVVSGESGNRTLTMTLSGDTTVTAEDRVSDLDGTFDLTLYKNVVINGTGTLNITYTTAQDGIQCYNLTIGENVTLNLTGYSATAKTGVSFAGTLQIDGTYNVNKFGNGIGINNTIDASATDIITVNGSLSITNCNIGIHSWNTPSGGATINFNGDVDITNIASTGIYLDSAVTINFNGGTVDINSDTDGITAKYMAFNFNNDVDVHITAVQIGINLSNITPDDDNNKMTMNSNSKLTIVSSDGSGIYCNNGGVFGIYDNSKLNITAASSGIYNFKQFRAYNGGKSATTMNTASVIVKTYGVTGSTGGKTSTAYGIHARESNTYKFTDIGFRTTGEVLIENLGTQSGVGFHAGLPSSGNGNIVIYGCTNFTIKNFSTAMSVNSSSTGMNTKTYDYSNGAKIKIRNCATASSGASWFTNIFKASTLDIQ